MSYMGSCSEFLKLKLEMQLLKQQLTITGVETSALKQIDIC